MRTLHVVYGGRQERKRPHLRKKNRVSHLTATVVLFDRDFGQDLLTFGKRENTLFKQTSPQYFFNPFRRQILKEKYLSQDQSGEGLQSTTNRPEAARCATGMPFRRKDCREIILLSDRVCPFQQEEDFAFGSVIALQCRDSCRGDKGWFCWGV